MHIHLEMYDLQVYIMNYDIVHQWITIFSNVIIQT